MKVSEVFYSIQGEGRFVGVPAVFIRLADCNLMCGGHDGKLVEAGKATWHCDTEEVWRKFDEYTSVGLMNKILQVAGSKSLEYIAEGIIHLVFTGGEPLLQQSEILDFLNYFNHLIKDTIFEYDPIIEIETNGTIVPEILESAGTELIYYNVSLKTANSGMPMHMRINSNAVERFIKLFTHNDERAIFKFVVSNKSDIADVVNDFIEPFNIPKDMIYFMPAADNREEYLKILPSIWDLSLMMVVRLSPRVHIAAWDKKVGV